ncbi:MAG: hypothetical protein ABFE08_16285 [Armatimonadia bacterium]
MTTQITQEEMMRTASHRLALAIGFDRPLSIEDVEEICDQGIADSGDFLPDPEDPTAHTYCGDRWAVEYSTGRPRLVEAIEVGPHPIGPATARAERAFALIIDMVDCVGPPMTQDCVDRIRRESWGDRFGRAAQSDATDQLLDLIYRDGDAPDSERTVPTEEVDQNEEER